MPRPMTTDLATCPVCRTVLYVDSKRRMRTHTHQEPGVWASGRPRCPGSGAVGVLVERTPGRPL